LNKLKIKNTLSRFFPVESVDYLLDLIMHYKLILRISQGRASKLGDFKPSVNGRPHKISVNGDMNIYVCLLIFLHELAHLVVWEQYGKSGKPHGREWKQYYGQLIRDFVRMGYFHHILGETLIEYSYKVKATGIASEKLIRYFQMFDNESDQHELLEDIPENGHFLTRTGRMFRKEEKLKKRYKCLCLDNKRLYLFHPMTRVLKET
jgi:SprT protein